MFDPLRARDSVSSKQTLLFEVVKVHKSSPSAIVALNGPGGTLHLALSLLPTIKCVDDVLCCAHCAPSFTRPHHLAPILIPIVRVLPFPPHDVVTSSKELHYFTVAAILALSLFTTSLPVPTSPGTARRLESGTLGK